MARNINRPWFIYQIEKDNPANKTIMTYQQWCRPWNHWKEPIYAQRIIEKLPRYMRNRFHFEICDIRTVDPDFKEDDMLIHRWGDNNSTKITRNRTYVKKQRA